MSSHHDHDNHPQEAKPVAFRTPLILALVTVLVILLGVSTCDKRHGCCENPDKCDASCGSKLEKHGAEEAHGTEHAATAVPAEDVQDHTAVSNEEIKADTAAVNAEEHSHH